MSIQATWRDMSWEISPQRIASLGEISTETEVKRVSDSTSGQSKITGRELQRLSIRYFTSFEAGGNPREEYKTWESKIGLYAPLRIAGSRFGPSNFQLRSAAIDDAALDTQGRIRSGTISLEFVEYADQISTGDMEIIYQGKDIYPDISVKACEHEMHAESQADSLVLRFNDTSHQWDSWSVEQESTIEVIEGAARTGKMYIYDVKPENGVYTLKAFSIPPTSKNRTSKSWEMVYFRQLCKEIADRHGLDYEEHGVTDRLYLYVVQNNEPDFVFLDKRCKLEGCSFLVFDGKLVVYGEREIEATSPQMLLQLNTDAKFTYSDNTAKSYKAAEIVNGTRTGTYSAATQSGSRVLHKNITTPMYSDGEADRFAQNLLRLENKNQQTGTIDWDIQRDLAPGSMLQLKTFGVKSWDGYAFVYRIRHDYMAEKSKIFVRKPLNY
ncbi:phage late control D family protein [uncultured Megasphaera sp.]|uniref:phage late control D family protein n=1 Tax=uncultured Megasphaera sp. TaxID=165188 RepID=UPI00266CFB5C|nr:hypothetical protein [uncultured Megasphaera sp.]